MTSSNPVQPAVMAQDHDAAVRIPSADPWDAPYFGAPVYFSYHPALATTVAAGKAEAAMRALAAHAQWTHFPYFGGPIYDAFPPFSPSPSSRQAKAGALEATGPTLDTLHPRFFGAPVYLTYEPDLVGFRRDSDLTPAPASALAPVDTAAPPPISAASKTQAHQTTGQRGGWFARIFWRRR
jgi:hypothetical protein